MSGLIKWQGRREVGISMENTSCFLIFIINSIFLSTRDFDLQRHREYARYQDVIDKCQASLCEGRGEVEVALEEKSCK